MKYTLIFLLAFTGIAHAQTIDYSDPALYNNEKAVEINPELPKKSISLTCSSTVHPLVIINGEKVSRADFNLLDEKKIKSVTVLKSAEALEKYGEQGQFGVIIISAAKNWKLNRKEAKKINRLPLIASDKR